METTCTRLIGPGLIDSVTKLRVLLVFCRHPQLRMGAAGLGQRLPSDPWALEEALDALAEADILERTSCGGRWEYALQTRPELRAQLVQLAASFDDPQRRDEIYALVRAAEQDRHLRDFLSEKRRAVGSGDSYEPLGI
jgi:hypothetical protein